MQSVKSVQPFRGFEHIVSSIYFWAAVCSIFGAILAWDGRHFMNPDGVSYLDMATEAIKSGPSKLINGYWSPGYPGLMSIALWFFRPSPSQEFATVHLLNFAIFCAVLCAFIFFLRSSTPNTNQSSGPAGGVYPAFIAIAFCTFLWFTLDFIGVDLVTPDLLVAGIVFLAAGIGWRISLVESSWQEFAALGLVLAAGYYIKVVMFPLAVVLLGALFLWPLRGGISRRKLLLSFTVFAAVVAPLVTLTSKKVGKLSIGEAGTLNYAWYVNGLQRVGWIGGVGPDGTPEHPPRTIARGPLLLEFASPIGGTYPLWSDPAYWYSGAKISFHLRAQLRAIRRSTADYGRIFLRTLVFAAGAFALWMLGRRARPDRARVTATGWQLCWALAALALYSVIHVETRLVAPFLVLFWLAIYRILLSRQSDGRSATAMAAVACAAMVVCTIQLLPAVARTAHDFASARPQDDLRVAARLHGWGIQDDDRVALVGPAFYPYYKFPYYLRVARLHIVAQFPDADQFWRLSPEQFNSTAARLAALGVKAVVATDRPSWAIAGEWKDVDVSGGIRVSTLVLGQPTAYATAGRP
jgi:hypothetical protein